MAGILDSSDPMKQEIARLESQIAMLKTQQPGMAGGPNVNPLSLLVAGGGGGQQQPFNPTINPGQMRDVYGLLAEYGDNPAAVGNQFVQAMQNNDRLKAGLQAAGGGLTDAQRPKPIGSGYLRSDGKRVIPIWDPAANEGRGGVREQELSEQFPDVVKVGKMAYRIDPNNPGNLIPIVDPRAAGIASGVIGEEEAVGTGRGTERAAGERTLIGLQSKEDQLTKMMNDPDFDDAVGPIDALTGRLGQMWGSDEGTLGKRAQFMANQLVTAAVADWKGAISERELSFFQNSAPKRGDSSTVWRDWYQNIFLPMKQLAADRAAGRPGTVPQRVQEGLQLMGDDPELDAIRKKYGTGQ